MNTTNYIRIFRGDDSDALGYQTIVGTIKTDFDLTGCKAVFRFLGFYAEFDPIPEDKKLTIVIPAQASRGFPPGVGYASLKVFDSLGKIRTFTNRIPVIVDTMTPSCGCGEFEVFFSPFPELEPLKIFIGPNADDFDQYTGFISKIIDRASLVKYGLAILADAMSEDGGASGKAASPLAVKAAYDAIIKELTDNYYNADQTEEAIDRVAAYYITRNAAGDAFETKAQLNSTTVFYSGGEVRVPTRNDYCVVLADETHGGAEYRYIYSVAEGQTTGSWQAQFPVEGVMTVDQTVQKNSQNPVAGGGVWSMLWGALSALPAGFTSLYDWCVSQLAGKLSTSGGMMTGNLRIYPSTSSDDANLALDGGADVVVRYKLNNITRQHSTGARLVTDTFAFPSTSGTFALTAGPNHAGNLAALDASGNPTDSGVKASDKLDASSASAPFSSDSSVSYAVGSHCTYQGKLYKCTTATTGGTWDASKWTADTMTNPDAVLDITSQNQLRVVAKDGTLLWAQGYDLTSTSSATLACDTANNFTFADGATTQAFTLPTAPTGKVGDFGLDIDNSANASAATMTLTGLDTTFSVVVPEGESLNDMLAIAAGELSRFYISLSTFRINNLPTWHIVKQVVENGGATV